MSTWLDIASWGLFGSGVCVLLAFVVTSLREREWRAAGLSLALGALALAPLLLVLLLSFGGRAGLLAVLLGLAIVLLVVLTLPWGEARGVRVVGEQSQVDEREAVFHRFYRLEPFTPEYEAYYAQRPEELAFDERVRAMPQLGEPGSRGFDPVAAAVTRATTEVLGRLTRELDEPEEAAARAEKESSNGAENGLSASAKGRVDGTPEGLSSLLGGLALSQGAALVGFTRLNQAFVYSHIGRGPGEWGAPVHLDHGFAVVIAVEMDHAMVGLAPEAPVLVESTTRYLESARIALLLAGTLRRLGHRARAHVDANYRVMAVPIAVDAGLGELGRLGLLITPELGPRVRLAVVTTDAPLVQSQPVSFGAAAFCEICKKCAAACPANAISRGPMEVFAGVRKWQSRGDTCYRHWRVVGTDCGLCLRVCPFSHPDSPVHRLVRRTISRNGLARRLALWGDDLLYGRRPTSGRPWPEWLRAVFR